MKRMGLIKSIQETYGWTLNSVVYIEYDIIRMNSIENIWNIYLKFKGKEIIIPHKFTIPSLMFNTTNNLGCINFANQEPL